MLKLSLVVTHRCHLDCDFCYQQDSRDNIDEITLDEIKRILDDAKSLGCAMVSLGGGEYFLRKDAMEIFQEVVKRRMIVKLKTVAHHITPARIELLKKGFIENIAATVFSLDPAIHNNLAGGSATALQRTMRGIELLRAANLPVTVVNPITSKNIGCVKQVKEWAEGLGAEYIGSAEIYSTESGREFEDLNIAHGDIIGEQKKHDLFGITDRAEAKGEMCFAARDSCKIAPNGDVLMCQPGFALAGNIREQSLVQIWHESPLFQQIRKTTRASFTYCKGCDAIDHCAPCMAMSFNRTGKLTEPDYGHCITTQTGLGLDPAVSLPPEIYLAAKEKGFLKS